MVLTTDAPVYTFKPREVVAVEHPMVIHNIDNGLKTFGRTPAFREVRLFFMMFNNFSPCAFPNDGPSYHFHQI